MVTTYYHFKPCVHLMLFASCINKNVLEVFDKLLPESKLLAYQVQKYTMLFIFMKDSTWLIKPWITSDKVLLVVSLDMCISAVYCTTSILNIKYNKTNKSLLIPIMFSITREEFTEIIFPLIKLLASQW